MKTKRFRPAAGHAGLACLATLLLACGTPPQAPAAPFLAADAYYALGRAEHAAGRPAAARRAWTLALQADARHADARNGMAVLRAQEGDYAGAIALWRALLEEGTAVADDADRAFWMGNLGYALYLQGEHDEALSWLEQACLLTPARPLAWEQLGAVLAALGRTERALGMMWQARSLRTHGIGRGQVLAGVAASAAPAPSFSRSTGGPSAAAIPVIPAIPAVSGSPLVSYALALPEGAGATPARQAVSPWPADLARTELRQAGAVAELHRVPPAHAALPAILPRPADAAGPAVSIAAMALPPNPAPAAAPVPRAGFAPALRLEIRNGNGVRGMAAAWRFRLRQAGWQSVRLTNAPSFKVPESRIEYREGIDSAAAVAQALSSRLGLADPRAVPPDDASSADLCIVLGRDHRPASTTLARRPAGRLPAAG